MVSELKFYSDEIQVTKDEKTRVPIAFTWREKEYKIKEIIAFWPDFSYPKGGKRKKWWQRKHKNFYRVLTEDGEVFEIYFDRGAKREAWILYTKID